MEEVVLAMELLVQTTSLGLDNPYMLALLIPALLFLAIIYRRVKNNRRMLNRFLEEETSCHLIVKLSVVSKFVLIILLVVLVSIPYIEKTLVKEVGIEDADLLSQKNVIHMILVDVSKSMNYLEGNMKRVDLAKNAITEYLKNLENTRDNIMLVVFSGNIKTIYVGNVTVALEKVGEIRAGEKYTALGDALSYALSYASASQLPIVVLLVTDGGQNYGLKPASVAEEYKKKNVPLLVVKIGSDPRGDSILGEISSKAGAKVYSLDDFTKEAIDDLVKEISNEARYSALKARGETYVEYKVKDYSINGCICLAVVALLFLAVIDGV